MSGTKFPSPTIFNNQKGFFVLENNSEVEKAFDMVPFLLLGLFLSHSLDSSPSPHAKIAGNCILGYISFFNLHAKMGIIAKYQKLPTCSAIEIIFGINMQK